MARVLRGDIVWADLNPTKGHEQAGLRPVLSESGPKNNWPNAIPMNSTLITSCRLFGFCTFRSLPILGNAGSIVSIDNATREIIKEITITNSTKEGLGFSFMVLNEQVSLNQTR